MRRSFRLAAGVGVCLVSAVASLGPELPRTDGRVSIRAQDAPSTPGPRNITVYVRYPGGSMANVNAQTGLMLLLHNWGGTDSAGAPDPKQLADRYNVVVISVDYLQSGPWDPTRGVPYDFGYVQALDALRALYYVQAELESAGVRYARSRVYSTGGSGGGNVALMANKLAPRTFACVVDISGMAKLNDDIAFGLPEGSTLNAGYGRDPEKENYLSPDAQALRYIGHPGHLDEMRAQGNTSTVVIIHGADDRVCPIEDVREMAQNMKRAGMDVHLNVVTQDDLDGDVIKDAGHSIGDRTRLLFRYADEFLMPDGAKARYRRGPSDFERENGSVRYETPGGAYVITYEKGYPTGRFEPQAAR